MKLKLALVCTIGFASVNAMAACYTVYDRANHVLYKSALTARDREIVQPVLERLGDQASLVAELVLGPVRTRDRRLP